MLQSISKQTAESLSQIVEHSSHITTLLGDFLRNEGIIGFEYRIESAYQEIALNNLHPIAKRYAQNHPENITSLQQLVYILLDELELVYIILDELNELDELDELNELAQLAHLDELNELDDLQTANGSPCDIAPTLVELFYMWDFEMVPKMDQVFNTYNTDLESFIYGWAICKGASVADATTISIKCAHSIEFGG